jgi:hypothetical protein
MIWVNLVFIIAVGCSAFLSWRAVAAGRRAVPATSSAPIASWQQSAGWTWRGPLTARLVLALHACSIFAIAALLIAAVNRATGNLLSFGYVAPGSQMIAAIVGINDPYLARLSLWAALLASIVAGIAIGSIAALALTTLFGPPVQVCVSAGGVSLGNVVLPWASVGAVRCEQSRHHLLLFSTDDPRTLLVTLAPLTADLFERTASAVAHISEQRAELPIPSLRHPGKYVLVLLGAIVAAMFGAVMAYRFTAEAVWFLYAAEIVGLSELGNLIFGKWLGSHFLRMPGRRGQ